MSSLKQTLASSDEEPQARTTPKKVRIPNGHVTFVWGREHYQPIQYHGFDVGPFELCVSIDGEADIEKVQDGAMAILDEIAKREFIKKRDAYLERVRHLADFMEAQRS